MAKTVWALVHEAIAAGKRTYGISFPDFPGLVSGGRSVEEARERGRESLAFHVAGMMEDGDQLPRLRGIEELRRDRQFREDAADVQHVCMVDVPVDLPGRQVRVNISIEDQLLAAIDRTAKLVGKNRSTFLAEAAREKLKSVA